MKSFRLLATCLAVAASFGLAIADDTPSTAVTRISAMIDDAGFVDYTERKCEWLARRLIAQTTKAHLETIEELKTNITETTKLVRTDRSASAETKKQRAKRLREWRTELKKLERIEDPFKMSMPVLTKYKVGEIGVTKYIAKLSQVVSDNDMLVEIGDERCWVTGLDTGGYADGDRLQLPYLFLIEGNKTYTTAIGGSNTVMVLQPFLKVGDED